MIVKTTQINSERLLSFLTSKTILLAMLLCFVVSANAQYGPSDDFDGDTIINSVDADDDNDGILDTVENTGSNPILKGFEVLYSVDGSGQLPTGSRAIVRNALTAGGVIYHAIVEVTGTGGLGGGSVIVTGTGNLALKDVYPNLNPYFTYSLKFVSSVGFVDANYQNSTPIVGATIPNITVVLADIDGLGSSNKMGEVAGYISSAAITKPITVGSLLGPGGFEFGTSGFNGPGASAYNYFRPKVVVSNTTGAPKAESEDQTNWITVTYDSFVIGEFIYGDTGGSTSKRGEGGPSMYMGNIDFTDIDGDNIDNSFDLDSDGDGCSDSNEAYANKTLANPGFQYGNPAVTTTGPNPIPGGQGGIAATNQNDFSDPWTPIYGDGKVKAATYTTTAAQYQPAVTLTKAVPPANVDLALGVTTATFTASATGASTAVSYKWQQKLNGSSTWTDVVNGVVGGVTYTIDPFIPNTLTITNITGALHNSDYQVILDDSSATGNYVCGTVTSTSAKLKLANISPVANPDTASTLEDTAVSVNVVVNTTGGTDTDADGTVDIATVDLAPATTGPQTTYTVAGQGTYTVTTAGVVTFTPVLNFNGTSIVNYTVNDNLGSPSNTTTLTVTVTAVNDAPVAKNDFVTISEDTAAGVNVVTNTTGMDTDIDGTINVATVDLDPATAGPQTTFTVTGQGTYTVDTAGLITLTPVLNYFGTATPINYTVNDNLGLVSNIATLTVTVSAVNDLPIANNDLAATSKDINVVIPVASNDTDIDGTIDGATIDLDPATVGTQNSFTVSNQGTYTANTNGTVTFDPLPSFAGTATAVNYVIQDNNAGISNIATIQVSVNADSDGDGVLDTTEVIDGTDALSACSSIEAHATEPLSDAFLNGDCDGDKILNKDEFGPNPKTPFDSNGNTIADYLEFNNYELSNSEDEIEVFNGVSPSSDDDKNSVFTIRNIEKYPNNSLQIYNRWGVVVYEAKGYGIGDKFFRGESQGRSTVSASAQLPEDTYFYALKYVNEKGDTKERTGYLYINR